MVFKNIISNKGQGALEYLLLIGGAILIAVIVISLIVGMGDQSKNSVSSGVAEAQSALNFTLPLEIVNIIPNSCSDNGLAEFDVFYNPIGDGGVNKIIVKDYLGRVVTIYNGDDQLDSGTYKKTIVLDLSVNNNKCTDTYWANIILNKDGTISKSSPKSFYWNQSVGSMVLFSNVIPDPNAIGYYDNSVSNISVTASVHNFDGTSFDWNLYSVLDPLSDCDDSLICNFTLPVGVHHIKFKGSGGSSSDIIKSLELIKVSSNPLTASVSVNKKEFSLEEDIVLTTIVNGSLYGFGGTYICKWYEDSDLLPNVVSCNPQISASSLGIGNHSLHLELFEEETQLVVVTNNINININPILEDPLSLDAEIIFPKSLSYNLRNKVPRIFRAEIKNSDTGEIMPKAKCEWFLSKSGVTYVKFSQGPCDFEMSLTDVLKNSGLKPGIYMLKVIGNVEKVTAQDIITNYEIGDNPSFYLELKSPKSRSDITLDTVFDLGGSGSKVCRWYSTSFGDNYFYENNCGVFTLESIEKFGIFMPLGSQSFYVNSFDGDNKFKDTLTVVDVTLNK